MNIFGKLAVSGLVLSMASVASAASVTGSTDFRITLPEVLVLYHWDDAHLTINPVAPIAVGDNRAHDLGINYTAAASTIEINSPAVATPNGGVNLATRLNVKLKDSWAVRSLSTANVSLALGLRNGGVLNNVNPGSTSTITVGDEQLSSNGLTSGASLSIPSGFAPVLGDIDFKLDLSAANNSGEYNTRGVAGAAGVGDNATDTFLLTLTGN